MQIKYGPPPVEIQPLYGVIPERPPNGFFTIISLITSPVFIIVSFVVGSILYLITHKKFFIIIPLILFFFSLLWYVVKIIFGFRF